MTLRDQAGVGGGGGRMLTFSPQRVGANQTAGPRWGYSLSFWKLLVQSPPLLSEGGGLCREVCQLSAPLEGKLTRSTLPPPPPGVSPAQPLAAGLCSEGTGGHVGPPLELSGKPLSGNGVTFLFEKPVHPQGPGWLTPSTPRPGASPPEGGLSRNEGPICPLSPALPPPACPPLACIKLQKGTVIPSSQLAMGGEHAWWPGKKRNMSNHVCLKPEREETQGLYVGVTKIHL